MSAPGNGAARPALKGQMPHWWRMRRYALLGWLLLVAVLALLAAGWALYAAIVTTAAGP